MPSRASCELAVDRTRRFSKLKSPVLYDLTSGYDSRFNICAAVAAGIPFGVTVNGPDTSIEVRIAKKVAGLLGVRMHHFDPAKVWTRPIDASMRRELVYRTGGGLRFPEAYHHLLTRPSLAVTYGLHVGGGVGTDILRYHAWSHELYRIGRRRKADVDSLMRYRVFQGGPPPPGLFRRLRQHARCSRRPARRRFRGATSLNALPPLACAGIPIRPRWRTRRPSRATGSKDDSLPDVLRPTRSESRCHTLSWYSASWTVRDRPYS